MANAPSASVKLKLWATPTAHATAPWRGAYIADDVEANSSCMRLGNAPARSARPPPGLLSLCGARCLGHYHARAHFRNCTQDRQRHVSARFSTRRIQDD